MPPVAHQPDQPMILLAIGGDPSLPSRLPVDLPAGSVVVAADSGLDRLAATGLVADHVVGDLDSVSVVALQRAERDGAVVHQFPPDKDATDIELAVQLIIHELVPACGLTDLLVVGSGGGRLDHLLADALLLSAPSLRALHVTAHLGDATVSIVRPGPGRVLRGSPGDQVSLLPVHGSASGVTTAGLRWQLLDADLVAGTTRAMSNELTGSEAAVQLGAGTLLAIQPGTRAAPIAPRSTPYDPTPRAPRSTT